MCDKKVQWAISNTKLSIVRQESSLKKTHLHFICHLTLFKVNLNQISHLVDISCIILI